MLQKVQLDGAFVNIGAVDMWGLVTLLQGCPVHWRMSSSFSGIFSLNPRHTHPTTSCDNQNDSRYGQMSLVERWEENCSRLRTAGLAHVDHHGSPGMQTKIQQVGPVFLRALRASSRVYSCPIRMDGALSRVPGQKEEWRWRGHVGKEL